jgi:hypothetical protein
MHIRRRAVDQPREGDTPKAQSWQVICTGRTGSRTPRVLSDGHPAAEDAKAALVKMFQKKADATDWPPTRAAYERGLREAREHGHTTVFAREYGIRPAPTKAPGGNAA